MTVSKCKYKNIEVLPKNTAAILTNICGCKTTNKKTITGIAYVGAIAVADNRHISCTIADTTNQGLLSITNEVTLTIAKIVSVTDEKPHENDSIKNQLRLIEIRRSI